MSGFTFTFRPGSRQHPATAIFLYAILTLMLASCGNGSDTEKPGLDHVADALPFPRPALEPQDSLSGTPPLPDSVQRTLDLRRAFFAGDFARVDAALNEAHDQYLNGRIATSGTIAVIESIRDTRLAGIDACADWLKNWQDALPVATRLIEEYPGHAEGYYQRARINEGLGRIPEARDDYRMAAAMGHDLALQNLILAHIRGGLGLPGKSLREVDELCRYGAALGSSVGANCMGSMFFEGDNVGAPFRRDLPQAYAWHLMAARAGHYNSQYDLGLLLYSGRAPGMEPTLAKSNGLFWMHRAAEQDHHFAKRKLEETASAYPKSYRPALGRT